MILTLLVEHWLQSLWTSSWDNVIKAVSDGVKLVGCQWFLFSFSLLRFRNSIQLSAYLYCQRLFLTWLWYIAEFLQVLITIIHKTSIHIIMSIACSISVTLFSKSFLNGIFLKKISMYVSRLVCFSGSVCLSVAKFVFMISQVSVLVEV